MIEVLAYLEERREEFARHLFVARMLEARVDDEVAEDGSQVEVRHVNTVKSGLLIHLYNIVEAVTTRTLVEIGKAIVTEPPKRWTQAVLTEWVRAAVWKNDDRGANDDRITEAALARLTDISSVLVSGEAPAAFVVKGEPGSWSDRTIKSVARRLRCELNMPDDVSRAAYERKYRNEDTAMQYLAHRRNAIAHGETTFEDGARELTLDELAELADRVLPFLKAVTESYEAFLTTKSYLTASEQAA